MRTSILVNPTAGSGRALEAGQRLGDLLPDAELLLTRRPGDGIRLARQARKSGVDLVVAVGGDGTFQEVTTGLCLDEEGAPACGTTRLGLLPVGTGGDYRRNHELSGSPHEAATRFIAPTIRKVDVGVVRYEDDAGQMQREAFLNVLSFGLGGLTSRLVERSPKWLGGRLTYFLGAARANLVYHAPPLEIEVDGEVLDVAPYSNVAVCIGRYFGGGMQIAPNAVIDDGLFDVVTLETSKMGVMALTADIYRGTHIQRPSVRVYRGRSLRARATTGATVLLDLDGNQPGRLPIEIEMLHQALELAL